MFTCKIYRLYTLCFCVCVILSCLCNLLYAQEKTTKHVDVAGFEKMSKAFYDKKIAEEFSPIEEWKCLDGSYFDLQKTNNPSVIFLGFAGCGGCKESLPAFAEATLDKKYSNCNFVYITFDDSATVYDEMKGCDPAAISKIKKIRLESDYIGSSGMAHGYPTIYFLNADKTVKLIDAFGEQHACRLNSKECWETMLDLIVN